MVSDHIDNVSAPAPVRKAATARAADGDRWRASGRLPGAGQGPVDRLPRQIPRPAAREGLLEAVDPSVWRGDWVVHRQPAGDGRESLRYLAPYVFRVAIGDHRIVSCDDGRVTFTYRKVGSKR